MGAKMKITKSKGTANKKSTKAEKVQGTSKVAKKKTFKTRKVQSTRNIANKTEVDAEKGMIQDIIVMAENMGIDVVNVIKTALIRAIQRAEGSNECYMSEEVLNCGQINCLWREDCASF
jgi:hypothetical protein